MAQKSVGRYWRSASEEDREELLSTFGRFMVANYAGNFDGFSGESFERQDKVDSTHGTIIVRTRLKKSDGDIVQLDYRLRQLDNRWKIIDIYLNGTVSELALRRSEYSTLIQKEGFEALIVALRKKIEDLSE
jgi:phospholipid transport system substrate-binding protein